VDYAIARERMVQEQLIRRGIKDERVLSAMREIPRHLFVEEALAHKAYGDHPLPIGEKQTISQPYMVAIMTEALELQGHERVLEIGTGSGYQTAVLCRLCAKVYSIERIRTLAERSQRTLDTLGFRNYIIRVGDGTHGWQEEAPFDGILVTAGAPLIPDPFKKQLDDGGRLLIPVGDEYSQMLKRITRKSDNYVQENITGCVFVKLIGNYGWRAEENNRLNNNL
jgi:protein-L-isoaspartate(D-aspartate) O-methyltransferase